MSEPQVLEKYYSLEKDDDGEPYYVIHHSECENCIAIDGCESILSECHKDIPVQWFCLGLIPYNHDAKDIHEKNNRIRCCVIAKNGIFSK